MRRVYQAAWHDTATRQELWEAPGVGLGHHSIGAVNPERQPLFSGDGKSAIVFCGKLFNYDRLRKSLEESGAVFHLQDNDAEFLLQLLLHTGNKHLPDLNGIYSAALWDVPSKRLTLVTDRYGFRPLYYHHSDEHQALVFSSRLRSVVDSGLLRQQVNWAAWSSFLYFGHNLGDQTAFKNVFLVPPGSVLRFADNQVHIEKYWDITSLQVDNTISEAEAVEGMAELFEQAIHRQNVPSSCRKAVFLSGGLDSRRIAAELVSQQAEIVTYTTRGFAAKNSDGPLAHEVANLLGTPHTFVDLPKRGFVRQYWERGNALNDYESNLHQWIVPLIDSLPESVKINYDGIAGDVCADVVNRACCLYDPQTYRDALDDTPQALARKIIGSPRDFPVLSTVIRKNLAYESVVENVTQELSKYSSTENQLACFVLLNRTRRGIGPSPFNLILMKAESFFPYLDNDVFDFTMRIPVCIRLNHTLRQQATNLAYPRLKGVGRTIYHRGTQRISTNNSINYYRQRRQWLRSSLWKHYVMNNWMFNNTEAFPRAVYSFLAVWQPHYRPCFLNPAILVFFEWLQEYRDILGDGAVPNAHKLSRDSMTAG